MQCYKFRHFFVHTLFKNRAIYTLFCNYFCLLESAWDGGRAGLAKPTRQDSQMKHWQCVLPSVQDAIFHWEYCLQTQRRQSIKIHNKAQMLNPAEQWGSMNTALPPPTPVQPFHLKELIQLSFDGIIVLPKGSSLSELWLWKNLLSNEQNSSAHL